MTESKDPSRKRVLAVSSGGGHWVELLRLFQAFDDQHVIFATVDRSYQVDIPEHELHVVRDVTRWNKVAWLHTLVQLVWILIRKRPHVVISTGALPGYFAIRLGKLLGCRTIWVDSLANADELSMSGQRIGHHADLWLTQWPHLAQPEGPLYYGQVL